MQPAVIRDFHGTLADVSEILPLVQEKRYDEFYEASLACPPIYPTVVDVRRSSELGYHNLLLTGMPERYQHGLLAWLSQHDVPIDYLAMRKPEDKFRKDFIVKRRMYEAVVDAGFYVMQAWEDSPGVIDLWRSFGIPTVVVPRANSEFPQAG
jgi:hypothetical protein